MLNFFPIIANICMHIISLSKYSFKCSILVQIKLFFTQTPFPFKIEHSSSFCCCGTSEITWGITNPNKMIMLDQINKLLMLPSSHSCQLHTAVSVALIIPSSVPNMQLLCQKSAKFTLSSWMIFLNVWFCSNWLRNYTVIFLKTCKSCTFYEIGCWSTKFFAIWFC